MAAGASAASTGQSLASDDEDGGFHSATPFVSADGGAPIRCSRDFARVHAT